ncbi:MAG: GNAT family N-acetyltransferase [bacterium]|nr:GNAT family N-acetyltransferase [bacterium]
MKILSQTTPFPHQLAQADALCRLCCQTDHSQLDFPHDGDFYVFAFENNRLLAALCLFAEDDTLFDLYAFTHPASRRQGLFTALRSEAEAWILETAPDAQIDFIVDTACEASRHTLLTLEAEPLYEDILMELTRTDSSPLLPSLPNALPDGYRFLRLRDEEDKDSLSYGLQESKSGTFVCSLSLFPQGNGCLWLHHVQTAKTFRRRGFAFLLLSLLLFELSQNPKWTSLRLHVTSDNVAALSLYKKAGFRPIQTLSHYAYTRF